MPAFDYIGRRNWSPSSELHCMLDSWSLMYHMWLFGIRQGFPDMLYTA